MLVQDRLRTKGSWVRILPGAPNFDISSMACERALAGHFFALSHWTHIRLRMGRFASVPTWGKGMRFGRPALCQVSVTSAHPRPRGTRARGGRDTRECLARTKADRTQWPGRTPRLDNRTTFTELKQIVANGGLRAAQSGVGRLTR